MKHFFTLSAAALVSAVALAGPTRDTAKSAPVFRNFSSQQTVAPKPELRPVQLQAFKQNAVAVKADRSQNAPAATYGAYYGFGDGTYHCSLIWDAGFYGYTYAIAQGFPYAAKFDAILGNKWTMQTASETIDLSEFADEDNNLVLSDLGIGGFYMPSITNRRTTYTYGANTNDNQVLVNASWKEDYPVAMFDANELDNFYGGVNTGSGSGYAYGSSTAYGPSGETVVSFGKVAGPLVVSSVNMWIMANDEAPMFATDEDYILATIEDKISEKETRTYHAYIREENIETSGNSSCAIASFVEIDEDGFEFEIAPVLEGEVTLVITNTEGCNYGIIMAASDVEDTDADGNLIYPSATRWYHDGSVIEEGYYRWQGADGAIYLNAHYNALVPYPYGTQALGTGYVDSTCEIYTAEDGTQYQWAVGTIDPEDGKAYNNFMVESTFSSQNDTIQVWADETLVGFDLDDSSYDDYGVLDYFFAVTPLPEGVNSRTIQVTLISNEEAELTFNIYQTAGVYDPEGNGINAVVADNKKRTLYNLQGQKTTESGLVVKDGKVVFIKK